MPTTSNANIRDIAEYKFTHRDNLFFDTNIWVYLHGRRKILDKNASVYSEVFDKIVAAKSSIYIDALVISEFVNTELRNEHNLQHETKRGWLAMIFSAVGIGKAKRRKKDFKKFKKSSAGKKASRVVADKVRIMLRTCQFISSSANEKELESVLANFAGNPDFNDLMIANICKHQNLKLVTHDDGFRHLGVPLLTALPRLLR